MGGWAARWVGGWSARWVCGWAALRASEAAGGQPGVRVGELGGRAGGWVGRCQVFQAAVLHPSLFQGCFRLVPPCWPYSQPLYLMACTSMLALPPALVPDGLYLHAGLAPRPCTRLLVPPRWPYPPPLYLVLLSAADSCPLLLPCSCPLLLPLAPAPCHCPSSCATRCPIRWPTSTPRTAPPSTGTLWRAGVRCSWR